MEILRMKDSLTVFLFAKKGDLPVSYATEFCEICEICEIFFNGLFIQLLRYLSVDRCHAIFVNRYTGT